MAAIVDFTIDQGTTFERLLEFTDADGEALPLTGYLLRGQIKTAYEDTTPAATFAFERDDVAGTAVMSLSDDVTAALQAGTSYVYDVELEGATGKVLRCFQGKIRIDAEVTTA